ncbi:MAG: DUF2817 domain-containing protein [Ilumatobacter sp.]|nr:DUF2817 domain-containing protein [Ilumatobacter sp.]
MRTMCAAWAAVALLALSGCATTTDGTRADAAPATDESTRLPSTSAVPEPATTVTTTTLPATTTTSAATTSTTTPTTTTTSTTTSTTIPVVAAPAPPQAASGSSIYDIRPPSDIEPPPLPAGWTTEAIGTSVQGRSIGALVRTVEAPRRTVLVIGGLHGNEPVSPPTVRGFVEADLADDVDVWLVPEANPDGVAAGTRWNGNSVDLNRNFSWDWRASDGGPGPISEPETQALTALVERLEPDLVVWVHQPYGYAASIGDTDRAFERAWAEASGVEARSGVTQHGGGESWTAFVAGRPSMLIEIDSWSATPETVAAHRAGFEAVLAELG